MLNELIKRASAKVDSLSGPKSLGLSRAIKKWTRIAEELENYMLKTSTTLKSQSFSALAKKRRMDVALTVNNIQQRKRRRMIHNFDSNMSVIKECYNLDSALISLIKRHAMGVTIDEAILDQLLHALNNKEDESISKTFLHIGSSLIKRPLAIDALLQALFIPSGRMKSSTIKSKCAKLVAISVFAAEKKLVDLFDNKEKEQDSIKSVMNTGLDDISHTANVSDNERLFQSDIIIPEHICLFIRILDDRERK